MVKKVRNPADETLLISEAMTIGALRSELPADVLPFLPEILHVGPDDGGDWQTQFAALDGFYSLEQVKEKHGGLDPRDAAWMFRRLLFVLAHTEKAGYLHRAPLPPHVMVHPEKHGLVLVDWTNAIALETDESPIDPPAPRATVRKPAGYEAWYGTDSEFVGPSDIFLAALTMIWLMGGDPIDRTLHDGADRKTRAFFGALTHTNWLSRPDEPFQVLEAYTDLIEELYGPRRFRPFSMSDTTTKEE